MDDRYCYRRASPSPSETSTVRSGSSGYTIPINDHFVNESKLRMRLRRIFSSHTDQHEWDYSWRSGVYIVENAPIDRLSQVCRLPLAANNQLTNLQDNIDTLRAV